MSTDEYKMSDRDIVEDVFYKMCTDCKFLELCQGRDDDEDFDFYQLSDCIRNGFKPKFGQYRLYNVGWSFFCDYPTMEAALEYQEDHFAKRLMPIGVIKDRLTRIIYGLEEGKWVELALMNDKMLAIKIARHVDKVDSEDTPDS
jgi:hypothetical protein